MATANTNTLSLKGGPAAPGPTTTVAPPAAPAAPTAPQAPAGPADGDLVRLKATFGPMVNLLTSERIAHDVDKKYQMDPWIRVQLAAGKLTPVNA